MRVSSQDVRDMFSDLLSRNRSREDIAAWASSIRSADDAEGIEYDPPSDGTAIWDALEFLVGVDLKDGPESFLHNCEDFERYWDANKHKFAESAP